MKEVMGLNSEKKEYHRKKAAEYTKKYVERKKREIARMKAKNLVIHNTWDLVFGFKS